MWLIVGVTFSIAFCCGLVTAAAYLDDKRRGSTRNAACRRWGHLPAGDRCARCGVDVTPPAPTAR